MRYEPYQQDGAWWFGITKQGHPLRKVGACASQSCPGHANSALAREHMRSWLLTRMVACTFEDWGLCQAPHRVRKLQHYLWQGKGRRWLRRWLPAITDRGYFCQVHTGLSLRLCRKHQQIGWVARLLPQPEEVLQ